VVYKTTCKNTGKIYIGNTGQSVKNRMDQHIDIARKIFNGQKGQPSETLAKHLVRLIPCVLTNPKRENVRKYVPTRYAVIWEGNPIGCVKTFATNNCTLCAREWIKIIKMSKSDPRLLMNSRNEIYGACHHNPTFHGSHPRHTPPIVPFC
jgi:hypothetical protein